MSRDLPPDLPHALPLGTVLNGFRIVAYLGAGGFGITYRAEHVAMGLTVAIKEFLPFGTAFRDPDRRTVRTMMASQAEDFTWGLDRFKEEARTLAALRHDNIVRVHDYFEAHGTAYMVMAFQTGRSLAALLDDRKTLDAAALRALVPGLLDGLAAVHGASFLHRDIKPDNIYVGTDGRPVLLDFGAARQSLGERSRSVVYSSGYAPYEQYSAKGNQGPWTDIYALGATLYRCTTGAPPPEATDRVVAIQAGGDPYVPAAKAAQRAYPAALLAAIDACLAVSETVRPRSIAALRARLASYLDGGDAKPVEPPKPPWLRRAAFAAATLVVLGGGAVAVDRWIEYRNFLSFVEQADAAVTRNEAAAATIYTEQAARMRPGHAEIARLRAAIARLRPAPEPGTQPVVVAVKDCDLCPEMIEVPAGTFLMGSPAADEHRYEEHETPQHPVRIAKPFSIGRYEVTVRQFRAYIGESGEEAVKTCGRFTGEDYKQDPGTQWRAPDYPIHDDQAVTCVSLDNAAAYARWLTRKTGKTYRLPTEAEWEYAARAGETGPHYWHGGGRIACDHANGADKSLMAKPPAAVPESWQRAECEDGFLFVAPVGRFKPNAWGLHDMLGNVWEWTQDCFYANYNGAPDDGRAYIKGECPRGWGVIRGGSWLSQVRDVRLAMRGYNVQKLGFNTVGFRVVREK